ncbi:MAG: hypothetical protein M1822_005235 [Bathelium mastoideum]|nr:MAG: hypothetical protein M1822_005235 [Bathelium mastoideum]
MLTGPGEEGLKRRETDELRLNGSATSLYRTSIMVGTPSQSIDVLVDTGSSVLILNSQFISGTNENVYTANASSSYHFLDSNMSITYAAGTDAGDWVSDTITIGDSVLPDTIFGVVYEQPSGPITTSILGLCPDGGNTTNQAIPDFLPYHMTQLGLIPSPSFSISLSDVDVTSGSLLFGGVDRTKYNGALSSFPIVPIKSDEYDYATIALAEIHVESGHGQIENITHTSMGSFPLVMTIDSGSPAIFLPASVTQEIYSLFGITADPVSGGGICNCSLADSNASVGFDFGINVTIYAPVRDLVIPLPDSQSNSDPKTERQCSFLILGPLFGDSDSSGIPSNVLGVPFLRNAYVVFDYSSYEIGLAQAAPNATGPPDIMEILPGENGIWDAQNVSVSGPSSNALTSGLPAVTSTASIAESSTTGSTTTTGGWGTPYHTTATSAASGFGKLTRYIMGTIRTLVAFILVDQLA